MQSEPANVVLSARGLSKDFFGFSAVTDVDIDVRHGEVHALIGPNGAGKTTVFNLLTKFLLPTRGTITLLGEDITSASPSKVARMGMIRSFQISSIFPQMTVFENVRTALQRQSGLSTQFWLSLRALDPLNEQTLELVERVGLSNACDSLAGDLSHGRKRVLEIATTLALDPKVLLLDEPMAGMGLEDIDKVSDIIRDLARDRAVLMVEHNLKVVSNLCKQVTVLQRGEILATGDYATVASDARVRTAYMGSEDAAA